MHFGIVLNEWLYPLWRYVFKWKHSISNPLSLLKTIYVNFKLLPFKQAMQLPIFIYKDTLIYELGKIEIASTEITTGMIRWGRMNVKSPAKYGKIRNEGLITFKGRTKIGGSNIIENRGHIILGQDIRIAEGVTIMIRSKLVIGERTIISSKSFIYDSDDHYTINVDSRKVRRITKNIIIGHDNWICTGTFVKKGTITGPYTLVSAGNTLLCKDYSMLPPYSILGGIPAQIIGQGSRMIRNVSEEKKLNKIFKDNPDTDEITIDVDDLESYCINNIYRD